MLTFASVISEYVLMNNSVAPSRPNNYRHFSVCNNRIFSIDDDVGWIVIVRGYSDTSNGDEWEYYVKTVLVFAGKKNKFALNYGGLFRVEKRLEKCPYVR